MSAGVILSTTSTAAYPNMLSAPMLNNWITPFSSVAMIEKLALLRIAFCKAPVFSNASFRRTSVIASVAGPESREATSDGVLISLLLVPFSPRRPRPHRGDRARGFARSVPLPARWSRRSFARRWPRSSHCGHEPGDRCCRRRASPPATPGGSSATPPRLAGAAKLPSRPAAVYPPPPPPRRQGKQPPPPPPAASPPPGGKEGLRSARAGGRVRRPQEP